MAVAGDLADQREHDLVRVVAHILDRGFLVVHVEVEAVVVGVAVVRLVVPPVRPPIEVVVFEEIVMFRCRAYDVAQGQVHAVAVVAH